MKKLTFSKLTKLITKLTFKEHLDLFKILFSFLFGLFWKIFEKDVWIFSERPNEARDNGFQMFEYVMRKNLHKESYYTLTADSSDFKKLCKYKKNVIKYGSFKHFAAMWACKKYISAHVDDGYPSPRVCYKLKMFGIYRFKYIFLQHGVVHNYHDFYASENTNASVIICSAEDEKNFLIQRCGYAEKNVKCVGLARFDRLFKSNHEEGTILVMPTWRRNLANCDKESFVGTVFYKNFHAFLKDQTLRNFASEKGLTIRFFLHKELQKFLECFEPLACDEIKILDHKRFDVQEELKNAAFLATDYSSVAFDFAYMRKPLIYFQFDYDDFRRNHTSSGYFDYKNDGFGEVFENSQGVIDAIISSYSRNFLITPEYCDRADKFFKFYDDGNRERNFEAIESC